MRNAGKLVGGGGDVSDTGMQKVEIMGVSKGGEGSVSVLLGGETGYYGWKEPTVGGLGGVGN